jgi:hypothetical protein
VLSKQVERGVPTAFEFELVVIDTTHWGQCVPPFLSIRAIITDGDFSYRPVRQTKVDFRNKLSEIQFIS